MIKWGAGIPDLSIFLTLSLYFNMGNDSNLRQTILIFIISSLVISMFGTIGYMLIEEWTAVNAFYMTVITLTTVGFGEVEPLSQAGRLFTVLLMIVGIGAFAYGFSIISQYLFTMSLNQIAKERRMTQKIDKLEGHFIVCGYGRVGQNATETMRDEGHNVVIIDNVENKFEDIQLNHPDLYYVVGDATDDDILLRAGLLKARGLLVCTGDDANNLFVVLSARALHKNLLIVARTSDVHNESKMMRAGADKVISPYRIGGQRMANSLIRPQVLEMLDVVTTRSGLELWLEDVHLLPGSFLDGKTIIEADIRRRTGATVVVLNRAMHNVTSPSGDTQLLAGDHLVVIGTREQVEKLEMLAEGKISKKD